MGGGPTRGSSLWTSSARGYAIHAHNIVLSINWNWVAGHDFFTSQPDRNATVFLLKQILHDWSDTYALKILSHLRQAAKSSTRMLIVESLVPYACHDPSSDGKDGIPGAAPREAPAPLLANYGPINDMQYNSDLTVSHHFFSQYFCLNLCRCSSRWTLRSVRLDITEPFSNRLGGALRKCTVAMAWALSSNRLRLFLSNTALNGWLHVHVCIVHVRINVNRERRTWETMGHILGSCECWTHWRPCA